MGGFSVKSFDICAKFALDFTQIQKAKCVVLDLCKSLHKAILRFTQNLINH
ncbi:hypothetical protein [Helicobacter sp. T3_23-1059]